MKLKWVGVIVFSLSGSLDDDEMVFLGSRERRVNGSGQPRRNECSRSGHRNQYDRSNGSLFFSG